MCPKRGGQQSKHGKRCAPTTTSSVVFISKEGGYALHAQRGPSANGSRSRPAPTRPISRTVRCHREACAVDRGYLPLQVQQSKRNFGRGEMTSFQASRSVVSEGVRKKSGCGITGGRTRRPHSVLCREGRKRTRYVLVSHQEIDIQAGYIAEQMLEPHH